MTIDEILRAVQELSPAERATLIHRLQEQTRQHPSSVDEKVALLRAAQLDVPVNREPSLRRADWYEDDGR